jgi:hypothetical protein
MKERKSKFSQENAQRIADILIDSLNKEEGSIKEKVYAVSHVLHALGETLYDKDDMSRTSLEEDYNASPTWAAALMLVSYLPHDILQKLTIARREEGDKNIE